jgi:hypothetical protein
MSVKVAKVNLVDALKELQANWGRVKDRWGDAAAAQFQADYIDGLETRIRAAIGAIDKIGELMASAKRECEDQQ